MGLLRLRSDLGSGSLWYFFASAFGIGLGPFRSIMRMSSMLRPGGSSGAGVGFEIRLGPFRSMIRTSSGLYPGAVEMVACEPFVSMILTSSEPLVSMILTSCGPFVSMILTSSGAVSRE